MYHAKQTLIEGIGSIFGTDERYRYLYQKYLLPEESINIENIWHLKKVSVLVSVPSHTGTYLCWITKLVNQLDLYIKTVDPPILKFLLHFCKIDDESELSRSRVEQFGIFSSISPAQPPHYSTLHPRQANTRTKQPIWFSLLTPTRPLLLHGDIVFHSTHTSAITPSYLETSHSSGLKMWNVPSSSLLEYFWYILYLEMLSWSSEIIPQIVKSFLESVNFVFETVIFFCWNSYFFFWNCEKFFWNCEKRPPYLCRNTFGTSCTWKSFLIGDATKWWKCNHGKLFLLNLFRKLPQQRAAQTETMTS